MRSSSTTRILLASGSCGTSIAEVFAARDTPAANRRRFAGRATLSCLRGKLRANRCRSSLITHTRLLVRNAATPVGAHHRARGAAASRTNCFSGRHAWVEDAITHLIRRGAIIRFHRADFTARVRMRPPRLGRGVGERVARLAWLIDLAARENLNEFAGVDLIE
ncbi:MAG: hypothetical protein ACXWUU_00975 [Burkholderiales bacterium]